MKTSQKGIDLIKSFEGTKLKAYKCSAGIATIGIGTTRYPNGNSVKIGDTCTLEQAETYLKHDLERFEDSVNRLVGLKIHQFMYDSLVSFAYNLGAGALQSSTLLKKVNLGKFKLAKRPNKENRPIKIRLHFWKNLGKSKTDFFFFLDFLGLAFDLVFFFPFGNQSPPQSY